MSNFKILYDVPVYDLYSELTRLLTAERIHWHHDQICVNSLVDHPDDFKLGTGSLVYDWDNKVKSVDNNKVEHIEVTYKKNILKEEDFTVICSQFKNTLFEKMYNDLSAQYVLGRIRIMRSKPKTCLSWHVDTTPRLHFPLMTQDGCFMVIGEEVKHLSQNNWWWTNTLIPHTAFNASKKERIHLVAVILEEK